MARAALLLLLLPWTLGAASPEPQTPQAAPKAADVRDTHRRLDAIYEKLGIKREEPPPQPLPAGGCQSPIPSFGGGHKAPAILGYVLIALVLAAMIVPLLIALWRTLQQRPPRRVGQAEVVSETESPPPSRPQLDLSQVRQLLSQGRLAEAYAALHQLTLEQLAQRQLLTLEQSTTNWGYVRQLAQRPPLQQLLSAVTEAAERAVLGQAPPPATHFQRLEQQLQHALEARR